MKDYLTRLTDKGMSMREKQNLFFPLSLKENEEKFIANINREQEAQGDHV